MNFTDYLKENKTNKTELFSIMDGLVDDKAIKEIKKGLKTAFVSLKDENYESADIIAYLINKVEKSL